MQTREHEFFRTTRNGQKSLQADAETTLHFYCEKADSTEVPKTLMDSKTKLLTKGGSARRGCQIR
jgi:hypothetical protein